jgi:hypothetical protein
MRRSRQNWIDRSWGLYATLHCENIILLAFAVAEWNQTSSLVSVMLLLSLSLPCLSLTGRIQKYATHGTVFSSSSAVHMPVVTLLSRHICHMPGCRTLTVVMVVAYCLLGMLEIRMLCLSACTLCYQQKDSVFTYHSGKDWMTSVRFPMGRYVSLKHLHQLLCAPSLLSSGYCGSFLRVKVVGEECVELYLHAWYLIKLRKKCMLSSSRWQLDVAFMQPPPPSLYKASLCGVWMKCTEWII